MAEKGPEAFRTISEAASEVGEPAHVLRFWETKFSIIRPMKRTGGRRFYRPDDIITLKSLRRLLHEEGRSIAALQRLSRKELLGMVAPALPPMAPPTTDVPAVRVTSASVGLSEALHRAIAAKARLDGLLMR